MKILTALRQPGWVCLVWAILSGVFILSGSSALAAPVHFSFTQPQFETIGNTESIPEGIVTTLAQDQQGLIWIGTQKGLIRYDGYQFRRFVHVENDPTSLAGDYILALQPSKDGRIWIGSNSDGLSVFDPGTERFLHFKHDPKRASSLSDNRVSALAADAKGGLWIGTDNGLDYLPRASEGVTQNFIHYRHDATNPKSLLDNRMRSLLLDRHARLWAGSASGLQRLARDGKNFETIDTTVPGITPITPITPSTSSNNTPTSAVNIQSLFEAQDGKLWLGTLKHGAAWRSPDPPTGSKSASPKLHWLPLNAAGQTPARPDTLTHAWVTGISQVQANQIWLATNGGGVNIVDASDGKILQQLSHDQGTVGTLALNRVTPFLLDRTGLLWVGTWGGGLQRYNPNNLMVRVLRYSPTLKTGLSHPDVRSVLELADGRILIGSIGNGIDIFDRDRGLIGGWRAVPGQIGTLPDATITALAQTKDGAIWAGTQQVGVLRMLPGSDAWQPVPVLPGAQVRRFLRTRNGDLWVATTRGVARWKAGKPGQPEPEPQFEVLPDEYGKPMESTVWTLAEDSEGRIWAGSNNGLWVITPGGTGWHGIYREAERPASLISNYITSLLADSRGRLWVATDKGLERLLRWDGKTAEFEHINTLLGSAGQIGQPLGENLLEDASGRIWTESAVIDPTERGPTERGPTERGPTERGPTERGPTERGPTERGPTGRDKIHITRLTKPEGMDIGGSWIGAYGKTSDGLLLFGGSQGVAVINPDLFRAWDYLPPLVVTALKINGKSAPLNSLARAQSNAADIRPGLTLKSGQRNFSIEFAALDYSDPKQNRYQYRLQGYDNDWIDTDSEHRSAAYGNLWPGNYILQVRGSNRTGVWSQDELIIPIQVPSLWYQSWWFASLALLTLLGTMTALVQVRTRYMRHRQFTLTQQVQQRTLALQNNQDELVVAIRDLHDSHAALNQANDELRLSVKTLRQLSDIGREITANLDEIRVFQALYASVNDLIDTHALSIYRMNPSTRALDMMFAREHGISITGRNVAIDSPTSHVAQVARERQELLHEYDPEVSYPNHLPGSRTMRTALFVPLIVDERLLGVMSIQSESVKAFGERECLIFRNLCAYGSIALANATALAALKTAQKQLVQQEKLASLGGLLAGIAHEINTPHGTTLTAISGAAGIWARLREATATGHLSKELLDISTEEGIEYTALASISATRTAELISAFKTIALHTERDRINEVNLASFIAEIVGMIGFTRHRNGIELKLDIPAGLRVKIVADALMEALTRILTNVLDHAFIDGKTSDGKAGWVQVQVQVTPEQVTPEVTPNTQQDVLIVISDNGQGIEPADMPKVFDPFFTTKSGLHGHIGLGLHVAYNHVTQRLKGQIEIASVFGQGTTVTIRFQSA